MGRIMSAGSAYELAKARLDDLCEQEFDELEQLIRDACDKGDFHVTFYKNEYYNALCDIEQCLEDADYECNIRKIYNTFKNEEEYCIDIFWGLKYLDVEEA